MKQAFIALISLSGSSATRFFSLNNKPFMIRSTLIDLNPADLIIHS